MADKKVWFITGCSKGFGRFWAEGALERGDRVVATARKIETLDGLTTKYGDRVLALALDVTDKAASEAAILQANEHFGNLDVVINNAGYGLFGTIEEVNEKEARDQMETNFFAALWITQAAIPIMREQKKGHIIQVSSIGGVTAFPGIGLYHASKWALEGFSESLAAEVKDFGISVTIVEPQGYTTDWSGASSVRSRELPQYDAVRKTRATDFPLMYQRLGSGPGDPEATTAAILKIVDAENPPLRLFLGTLPLPLLKERYAARMATWEAWEATARSAWKK